MQVFLNVLVFCVWFLKGEKDKNDSVGWKGFWSLNILEFTSVREGAHNSGGRYNKWLPPLFLYLCDQKQQSAVRAQTPDVCGQGPFRHPWLLQAVCKLLQECVHSCLPCGWGGGMGDCYCAKH